MTRRGFRWAFIAVTLSYAVLISLAFEIRYLWPDSERTASWQYSTFKDVVPLLVAIPAAWLAFCVQRRLSYLQQLRLLWSKLVEAMQAVVGYTNASQPQPADHEKALRAVSTVIDEIRAVFKNIDEKRHYSGLYPFGGLKGIHGELRKLDCATFDAARAARLREDVLERWREIRSLLLYEFDRHEPTRHNVSFLTERDRSSDT